MAPVPRQRLTSLPPAGAGEHSGRDADPPRGRRPLDVARQVLSIEAEAIRGVLRQLDESFVEAMDLLLHVTGRVVCTGMGKSGLVMKKIAATLASTGTPSLFLHPAEAIHGDLGMIVPGDGVLAASFSGTTQELLRLVETLKRQGVPLVAITGNPSSPLARHADIHLGIVIDQEACPLNLAPTASTTATLALGDALAMALLEARGFTPEDFARLHPGGRLGKHLLKVEELMHRDDEIPRVQGDAPLREAIYEMSRKGLGMTAVTDREGLLVGIVSDGDLRRLLETEENVLSRRVADCMKPDPKTIAADELAPAALKMMEQHRITSLLICDTDNRLQGVLHIHDLWGLELF